MGTCLSLSILNPLTCYCLQDAHQLSYMYTRSPSTRRVHAPQFRLGAHLAPQDTQGPSALPCLLLLTLHAHSPFTPTRTSGPETRRASQTSLLPGYVG